MTLGVAEAARSCGRGLHVPLAVDFDPIAVGAYRANFPRAHVLQQDLARLFQSDLGAQLSEPEAAIAKQAGAIDVLVGGPPCQGNSNLNNWSRRTDGRNALYALMARAALVIRPSILIIENVPSVVHDRGEIVEKTTRNLEHQGYDVASAVLKLWRVGVPQLRRRHILLASRLPEVSSREVLAGVCREDSAIGPNTVRWAIEDLARLGHNKPDDFDRPGSVSEDNRRRIDYLFDNDAFDLVDSERPPCHKAGNHTYKSMYGRLRWDEPAQTITTGFGSMGQGRYVHPAERRTISPHEAARIQAFPDFFDFRATPRRSQRAKLIGNAVPPFLTWALMAPIMPYLSHALSTDIPRAETD
jgi:DNA (cytosine-5)-methyltransferase 1